MANIVLLHGMWSHPGVAAPLRRHLARRGHLVFAPALPGHIRRDPLPPRRLGRLSLQDYAKRLHACIASQRFDEPPVLVGHSMGGLLAQMLAERTETRGLVLLNSAAPAGTNHIFPSSIRSSLNLLLTPFFWNRAHTPSFERATFALFNEMDPGEARRIYDTLVAESGRCYAEIVFWFLDPRRSSRLESPTDKPVFLVSGGRDHIVHPHVAHRLSQRYPHADVRILPENGHWLFGEAGCEDLYGEIGDWIENLSGARDADDESAPAIRDPERRASMAPAPEPFRTPGEGAVLPR